MPGDEAMLHCKNGDIIIFKGYLSALKESLNEAVSDMKIGDMIKDDNGNYLIILGKCLFKAPKIKIIKIDSVPKNDTLTIPLSEQVSVPLSVPLSGQLPVPLSGNIIRLITDNYITINDNYEEIEKFILNLSGKKPKIELTDDLFQGLKEDFAEYVQNCINSRAPIFLKKEIANKKNTYFQLVKNIPAFKNTIKHLRLKEIDETLEDCEKRIDKALVDWLKEQTAGKIEHSWENIPDIAQHALNYIRKQEKLTKNERTKSHLSTSPNKHTGAIETKSNDYSRTGW